MLAVECLQSEENSGETGGKNFPLFPIGQPVIFLREKAIGRKPCKYAVKINSF
jgi:hypothetical protein